MWPVVCKHFGKDMHAANQVITRQFKLTEHGEGEIPADKVFKGELHTVIVPPAKQAYAFLVVLCPPCPSLIFW